MISASLRPWAGRAVSGSNGPCRGTPAIASNLRSMATLLTSDLTLAVGESCASAAPEPGSEVSPVLWATGTSAGLGSVGIDVSWPAWHEAVEPALGGTAGSGYHGPWIRETGSFATI